MKFGQVIKKVRTEKGFTQGNLAKVCSISRTYLSEIENGVKVPSNGLMNEICKHLNVPASVVYYLAIEVDDVPANKRSAFNQLSSTIESLVKSVYF